MGKGGQEAPDYAAANRESVIASTQSLPIIQKINNAAQLGTTAELSANELAVLGLDPNSYQKTDSGNYAYADFTGQGNDVIADSQTQAYLKALGTTTPELLKLQQEYGTDFAEASRAANEAANQEQYDIMRQQANELSTNKFQSVDYTEDPTERALRDTLTQQYADEVALGTELSDSQRQLAEQSTRRAQMDRGNIYGNAASIQEALDALDYGTSLQTQRRNAAQSWLTSGQNSSAYDLAARTTAANQSNNAYQNYISALQSFQTSTPGVQSSVQSSSAGSTAQQSTLDPSNIASTSANIYGTNSANYNANAQNSVSPFAAAVGLGTNLVGLF